MQSNIKDNIDMSRWICVSAEKLYIVNSGDVIFMVMGDNDWAKSIYDEFVKYMEIDRKEVLKKIGCNEYPHALMASAAALYLTKDY